MVEPTSSNRSSFTQKPNKECELQEEYDLAQLPIMPKGRYAPERRNCSSFSRALQTGVHRFCGELIERGNSASQSGGGFGNKDIGADRA
jgi:hypothetical protein